MYKLLLLLSLLLPISFHAMDNNGVALELDNSVPMPFFLDMHRGHSLSKEEIKSLKKKGKKKTKLKHLKETKQYVHFSALTKKSYIVPYNPHNHRYEFQKGFLTSSHSI